MSKSDAFDEETFVVVDRHLKADGVNFREAHTRLGGGEAHGKPIGADDLHSTVLRAP